MREKLRKNLGLIYIVLITAAIAVLLLCSDELTEVAEALHTLNGWWVAAAAGCVAAYLALRMAAMRFYLCRHGYPISWIDTAAAMGSGQFYSAITPSASGGQPMQVLLLRRLGVPVGVATVCVSVKFIGFQAAILLLGGTLWLSNSELVSSQLYGFRWLIALGFAVNAGLIAVLILAVAHIGVVDWLGHRLLAFGARLKLVRRSEELYQKLRTTIEDYRAALCALIKRPLESLMMFALALLQAALYMCVPVCLYYAFGMKGFRADEILTLQTLLFIAAAFIPLPGAAGAQESGFCLFFRGVFAEDCMIAAMLCWRFFSYYLLMLVGAGAMVAGEIWFRWRGPKRNAEQ